MTHRFQQKEHWSEGYMGRNLTTEQNTAEPYLVHAEFR